MPGISIKEGQSYVDIAVQITGDATGIFLFALENNLSITEQPVVGGLLQPVAVSNQVIADLYKRENILPASIGLGSCSGIGCWAIEVDFVVS